MPHPAARDGRFVKLRKLEVVSEASGRKNLKEAHFLRSALTDDT
jgi:hypothetical protein